MGEALPWARDNHQPPQPETDANRRRCARVYVLALLWGKTGCIAGYQSSIVLLQRYIQVLWAVLIGTVCANCGKPVHHQPTRAIYYWKTIYQPESTTKQRLKELQVQRMYLRLFDADIPEPGGKPAPVAILQLKQPLAKGIAYVPVVYITQRALQGLTQNRLHYWAAR